MIAWWIGLQFATKALFVTWALIVSWSLSFKYVSERFNGG